MLLLKYTNALFVKFGCFDARPLLQRAWDKGLSSSGSIAQLKGPLDSRPNLGNQSLQTARIVTSDIACHGIQAKLGNYG